MAYEPTPFDQYTTSGLSTAQGLLSQNQATGFQYPQYVSSAQNAPTQQQYYNYTPTTPLAQVQAPNYKLTAGDYQGLMGNDWNALQSALTLPGQQAAQSAYQQGYNSLTNTMGGQGLYGSSIMQNQATQGLDKTYQQALAQNAAQAAAQRYGLEQQGLQAQNQFNLSREQELNKYGMQGTQLAQQQAADTWKAGQTETANQMQYAQGKMNWDQQYADLTRNWQNQQAYEKYTYDLARQQAQNAGQEQLMNQALALAGQGAPLSQMATQANLSQQQMANQAAIANQQANTASNIGWLGAIGTLGGGLLGNSNATNAIGSGISDLYSSIFG